MAILNCTQAKRLLPEFLCRYYISSDVPVSVIERLKKLNAEIYVVSGWIDDLPGTFWRFAALEDKSANRILIRDVDSLIDDREVACTRAWIESDTDFHIIRDDCAHTELILAGLFSAKAGTTSNVIDKAREYCVKHGEKAFHRYSDQLFLRESIWPIVRDNAFVHDRIYKFGKNLHDMPERTSTPNNSLENDHIGGNYATAQITCNLSHLNKDHENLDVVFELRNEHNQTICIYNELIIKDNVAELNLPKIYFEKINKTNGTIFLVIMTPMTGGI